MRRYRLTIEYDGSRFCGWQRQKNGPSVQMAIEAAIGAFCGEAVRVQGAGRTDAGVHALGQVAHFDLAGHWPSHTIRDALNFHLRPAPVVVVEAAHVDDQFDARFSATARHYRYRIMDRRPPPAIGAGRVWHVPVRLDAEIMARAGAALVGRHDFTTFRAAACQARSPVKTINRLEVSRVDDEIRLSVSAPSFLHHQVRSIAGSLKEVGAGRRSAGWIADILAAADRKQCGPVAPAEGLYLMRVDYPAG